MAPTPGSARSPAHQRQTRGRGLFAHTRLRPPPKITYGKRETKILSLTARQFRSDTYALLSDEEDEVPVTGSSTAAIGDEADLEDSELSDAEPAGHRSNHKQSKSRESPSLPPNRERFTPPEPEEGTVSPLNGGPDSSSKAPERRNKAAAKAKSTKHRTASTRRRLPTNELVLVATPPAYATDADPPSSYHGVQTQDPITEFSSSPSKRMVSPISSDDSSRMRKGGPRIRKVGKTPLTAIRKRLQTGAGRFKSLAAARRNRLGHGLHDLVAATNPQVEPRGRDGFDRSELVVQRRPRITRQKKTKSPLIPKFEALQLRSGPLPDVDFHPPIKLEIVAQDDEAAACDEAIQDMPRDYQDEMLSVGQMEAPVQSSTRRVSFGNQALKDMIRAELSSISAPERVPSESEDDEMVDDDDDDKGDAKTQDDESECWDAPDSTYGDAEGDEETENGGDVPDDDDQEVIPYQEDELLDDRESIAAAEEHEGVTLDFRHSATTPQAALARSIQRHALIEVQERIFEVPDSDPHPREQTRNHNGGPHQPPASSSRPVRTRSILKNNSTPFVPDSTSRPEATAANTRQNSVVDLAESRYFSSASNALKHPDARRHIIVPRRPSHNHSNSYIEVPHTDCVIPDTSPGPQGFTNSKQLNVLRENSGEVWMSTSNATATPRGLKALTRSVSREHGTLSQSVRRKSSLPFHSPKKM